MSIWGKSSGNTAGHIHTVWVYMSLWNTVTLSSALADLVFS